MATNNNIESEIKNYCSAYSAIWKRCKEVAEKYYEAGIYIKNIHYVNDFEIYDDMITIYEQSRGMDIELKLEDFIDDEKLSIAISKDIQEYLENN